MKKNLIALILILAVIGSMGDGCANEPTDSLAECQKRIVELEMIVDQQDSCLVMCHEQTMFTYDKWRECENQPKLFKSWQPVGSLPSVYDSTVVIDGIIYECANQANWPYNDGVLKGSAK